MVKIMFNADRFVVPPSAVNNDAALLGHAIKQLSEIRQVRKILRFVYDENRKVESFDIDRVRHGWKFGTWLAKHGNFMTECLASFDILSNSIYSARKAVQF